MTSIRGAALLGFSLVSLAMASPDIHLPSGVIISPGDQQQFPVTLSSAAPAGGVFITLSSSDTSKLKVSPEAIFIPEGGTGYSFVQITGISAGTASVSASAANLNGDTQTVQIGAGTPLTLAFSPSSITIAGTGTQNVSLSLSTAAPLGGITVSLSSDDTNIARVQQTIGFFPDGSSQAINTLPIVAVGPGTTTIHASAPGFAPTTLSVTVNGPASIILPSGTTLSPAQTVSFPVTLTSAAPAGGVTVTLTSSDPGKVTIAPASVVVPAGSTSPAVQPQITGVSIGSSTIGASAFGYTAAGQTVQVQPATGAALSFTPSSLIVSGLGTRNLTLNLSPPAPSGGLTVNLISNNTGAVTVPATVTFVSNSTSLNVPVTSIAPGVATITASAPNVVGASANVTVNPSSDIILPSGLTLAPGDQLRFQVTLANAAPSGGIFVTLSISDSSKVTVSPSTVFISQGQTTSPVQPQLTGISFGSVTLSAEASGLLGDTEVVLVGTAHSLLPSSMTITGVGATQNLSLTLSSPAPVGGVTFNLSSSNTSVATVPASVTVVGNTTGVSVPVTSVAPGTTVIHSSSLPAFGDTTANVTVVSSGTISLPANVSLGLGQSVPFPVTIGTPAPTGGLTVSLSSADSSKVTVSPATVSIAAGATTPSVQPQVTGMGFGSANISASASGYTTASQSVQVNGALNFSPTSLAITGATVQNLPLVLSVPAPAGFTATLNSSNPAAATVPGSIAFTTGATSANVPITGVATGSTTITATANAPNVTNATASVSVSVGSVNGVITLPANVTIGPNQPAPFPVTLSVPAPAGGVTVTLSSSVTAAVSVTPTVFIAAGAVTPATQPQITGVTFGTSVITASAPSYTSATQAVQVGAALSFTPPSVTLSGPGTGTLHLNLSTLAPSGGLIVNLSSNNPASVTVPSTVTIPGGASTVNVPVTELGTSPATITASTAAPNVTSATASVIVSLSDIILPSGLTLLPGQQLQVAVVLRQPAPAEGVFVTLSSSDTSKLMVAPTTVIVPQGSTTSTIPAQITGVDFGTAILSATANGLIGDSKSVQIGTSVGFSPSSLTIAGIGVVQNLVLNLPSPAPAGGLTINLSSTNIGVVTVPATIVVPGNSSTANVPVTSTGAGSATLHASALPSLPDTTASVNVVTSAMIGLPSNVSVALGQSVVFPVVLGTSAPAGGVVVMLTSSDVSRGVISPSLISIPQGATTPAGQPVLTAFNIGTITISASAPGFAPASQLVTLTGSVTFSPTAITIASGGFQRVLLSLASAAPPGTTTAGRCENPDPSTCSVTVSLSSSNPSVAQVQPSVSFFPDGSSQAINQILIQALNPGTAVIHAGAPPYIPDTTLIVTVQ